MNLKAFATTVLITVFAFAAQAQPTAGPQQVLQQGIGKMAAYLKAADPRNTRQLEAFLDTEIAPYFDFKYMAKWASGTMSRHMNPGQQAQFEQGLQRMFLTSMASQLAGTYSGNPSMSAMTTRRGSRPNEAIVSVRIVTGQRPPIRLDFRMYQSSRGWKVFDVMANSSSAVMYYRNYFSQMVRRYGVQGVLAQM